MEKPIVITINREFGSGGRLVGERLAKKLGMKLVDKMLLEAAAKELNMSKDYLKQFEEKAPSLWDNLTYVGGSYHGMSIPVVYGANTNTELYAAQTQYIKALSSQQSCVVIGRCANAILKEQQQCISVFLHAPVDYRIKNLVEVYGFNEEKDMAKAVQKIDKQRSDYYRTYTQTEWRAVENYDLILDTSKLSVEQVVELIESYVSKRKETLLEK